MTARRAALPSIMLVLACANRPGNGEADPASDDGSAPASTAAATGDRPEPDADVHADVLEVQAEGAPGEYTFAVTLRSPDTGCDRYADWWEVIDADGDLLYRRILAHSHVDEQPFTRSGGPVPAPADAPLWIRAHMHGEGATPEGYGGQSLMGSVRDGFVPASADEPPPLHETPPLPDGCAF